MRKSLPVVGALMLGSVFLAASVFLVSAHLSMLRGVREKTLPLASELPPLERRLGMLTEQLELTGLQASLRSGSPEEKLHAYVLPEKTDLPRLMALFDVTRILLDRARMARSFSAIEVGEPAMVEDGDLAGLQRQTVSFDAVLSPEGTERVLSLLDLTGLLTVGDALSKEEIDRLFTLTEAENYSGITALEKFLGGDLLSYARDPRPSEDQLLKSFSSERFLQEFRSMIAGSRLTSARDILGGDWGNAFTAQRVWPAQFLDLTRVSTEALPDGWNAVHAELALYSRPNAR